MKKRIIIPGAVFLIIVLTMILLSGGGNVRDAERIVGESSLYSQREIEAAMDVAVTKFKKDFNDCELLKIAYDEEKTISEREYQKAQYGKDEIIVLVSDFYVGDRAEPTFLPNQTYNNWKWILENSEAGWKLIGYGYG